MEKQSFNTFDEVMAWAKTSRIQFLHNRIWLDLFESFRPKTLEAQVFGYSQKTARDCKRFAPDGKFWVIPSEGTDEKEVQVSLWYDRYLPYAYAMMNSERGYKALGVDFDSVNAYFSTCMGFCMLGQDYFGILNKMDADLYEKLAAASYEIQSPSLPFDEAFLPACCFCYAQAPKLFVKFLPEGKTHWIHQHVQEVMHRCHLPIPKVRWPKARIRA